MDVQNPMQEPARATGPGFASSSSRRRPWFRTGSRRPTRRRPTVDKRTSQRRDTASCLEGAGAGIGGKGQSGRACAEPASRPTAPRRGGRAERGAWTPASTRAWCGPDDATSDHGTGVRHGLRASIDAVAGVRTPRAPATDNRGLVHDHGQGQRVHSRATLPVPGVTLPSRSTPTGPPSVCRKSLRSRFPFRQTVPPVRRRAGC